MLVKVSKVPSGLISVTLSYDPQLVTKVKTISGHKWHRGEKYWIFPDTAGTSEMYSSILLKSV